MLEEYAAEYENPAYGLLKISIVGESLQFEFQKILLSLHHFHYDRFDTPDDEQDGKWSVSFQTNPQGDIDKAMISLDGAEVTFTRRPEAIQVDLLSRIAGGYERADGSPFEIVLRGDGTL